jgi:hypothetical protein
MTEVLVFLVHGVRRRASYITRILKGAGPEMAARRVQVGSGRPFFLVQRPLSSQSAALSSVLAWTLADRHRRLTICAHRQLPTMGTLLSRCIITELCDHRRPWTPKTTHFKNTAVRTASGRKWSWLYPPLPTHPQNARRRSTAPIKNDQGRDLAFGDATARGGRSESDLFVGGKDKGRTRSVS